MLPEKKILDLLNTLPEHKMAADIFVPLLQKIAHENVEMGGVRFTGGIGEKGIDVEYYELTRPEGRRSYVGIQFKKGDLCYSGTGKRNSIKDIRNQAEEAFEKLIHNLDGTTYSISRFIVAVVGKITEEARRDIRQARIRGTGRGIDYWPGDVLATYINEYWLDEFKQYFKIQDVEAQKSKGSSSSHSVLNDDINPGTLRGSFKNRLHSTDFVGRSNQIKIFKRFMRSDKLILNYFGVSGMGKSMLLNHLAQHLDGRKIAKVNCGDLDYNILAFMKDVVKQLNEMLFANYTQKKQAFIDSHSLGHRREMVDDTVYAFASDLQILAQREPIVVFIDSFEKGQVGGLAADLRRNILCNFLGTASHLKVVVAGWNRLDWSTDWETAITTNEVKAFDSNDFMAFVTKKLGVSTNDKDTIKWISGASKGYPLALGVLADLLAVESSHQSSVKKTISELKDKIQPETSRRLIERLIARFQDEYTFNYLSYVAVPRWFDAAILSALTDLDDKTSQVLVRQLARSLKSFIKPLNRTGYKIHEVIRTAILDDLMQNSMNAFLAYNAKACDYFREMSVTPKEETQGFDLLYHLVIVNEKEAVRLYQEMRYKYNEIMRRRDLAEALQSMALERRTILPIGVGQLFSDWTLYGDASLLQRRGFVEEAEEIYDQLLAKFTLDIFLKTRILDAKANISWGHRGDKQKAIRMYKDSCELKQQLLNEASLDVDRQKVELSIADFKRPLARLLEIEGRLKVALEELHQALAVYRKYENTEIVSIGITLKWIGRNLRLQGKWLDAVYNFEQAEKVFQKAGNDAEVVDVKACKAALWKEQGRWEDADKDLRRIVRFLEERKDTERLGIALIDLGDILRLQGDLQGAKGIYERATAVLAQTPNRTNDGFISYGLGEIARVEGNIPLARKLLSEAYSHFSILEHKRGLVQVTLSQSRLDSAEDPKRALKNLELAYNSLSKSDLSYCKSAALLEICKLKHLMDDNPMTYSNYLASAFDTATQGRFCEHLAELDLLQMEILGLSNFPKALASAVRALSWSAQYNKAILEANKSRALIWAAEVQNKIRTMSEYKHAMELVSSGRDALDRAAHEFAKDVPEEVRECFEQGVRALRNASTN